MRTLQEQLQERMRAVLQRNATAASQSAGPRIPMIGERYRDERGRMITVTASSFLEVTFKRDEYPEPCVVPLWQFDKQFKRVGV
ncbi:DUF4222 domain-containing protein [Serratia marcescens]|uniref:DUF4222 domain-containing protein n=1 Tax=Serratia marcescens TaxID=615 RepID=UPI001EF00464|nr:DUF4222 domain-containing protein [Serratia marcescens]ULH09621.1 DUF4222 domain-containing protein [Serratia marcescens]